MSERLFSLRVIEPAYTNVRRALRERMSHISADVLKAATIGTYIGERLLRRRGSISDAIQERTIPEVLEWERSMGLR